MLNCLRNQNPALGYKGDCDVDPTRTMNGPELGIEYDWEPLTVPHPSTVLESE